jgi:hypothetical protein
VGPDGPGQLNRPFRRTRSILSLSACFVVPASWHHLGVPWAKTDKHDVPFSANGAALTRPVAFKFALDLTVEQSRRLFMRAGARRFAYNHHIGRVKDNLSARTTEKEAGTEKDQMTPSLSWRR